MMHPSDVRTCRRDRPGTRALLGLFALLALGLIFVGPFSAQERGASDLAKQQLEYTKAHYVKHEHLIPMRDGTKLFTVVYVPKDTSRAYPIMIQRTPYSVAPYGAENYRPVLGPSELFTKEGFIFAYQDVRGRYMSEGEFDDIPYRKTRLTGPTDTDEATDTYDTVDWLVKNVPGNNGRAGIWGVSYGGFFAAFGMIDAHPALVAASPQAPIGDIADGDDAFHNGAFYLAANFGFYRFFRPRPGGPEAPAPRSMAGIERIPDAYDFFLRMGPLANSETLYFKGENPYWTYNLDHATYDEFWQALSLVPHMRDIKPAVLFVGGWFDAEDLAGPIKLFYALENTGPRAPNTLVMGPWRHGGWSRGDGDALGNLKFGSKTSEFYREAIEFPFFLEHLNGKGDGLKGADGSAAPKAWLFATGINEWRRHVTWPPAEAREASLYLLPGGKLAFEPGQGVSKNGANDAFDEYVSDPSRPVPVIGHAGDGMPGDYMAEDQRFAARRPDVLVYETEPLESDVTIAGPVRPFLRVSTSGTDSDFVVKLIDVYPNDHPDPAPNPCRVRMGGYQQLVRGEPFRGKFRNSLERPEPFTPGRPETIDFSMPDVYHTFRKGHRIMIHIQSSWFPLIDRNPQTFVDIPKATEADFKKATQRVYLGGKQGSRLRVLVLEK